MSNKITQSLEATVNYNHYYLMSVLASNIPEFYIWYKMWVNPNKNSSLIIMAHFIAIKRNGI